MFLSNYIIINRYVCKNTILTFSKGMYFFLYNDTFLSAYEQNGLSMTLKNLIFLIKQVIKTKPLITILNLEKNLNNALCNEAFYSCQ